MAIFALCCACRQSPDEHLQRARSAIYEKDPQRALREFRLTLDAVERDRSSSSQALRARALLGSADTYYFELHQYPQAVEYYRELIQACPDSPESVEAHIRVAELLHDHYHDLKGAIVELSAALARNTPQNASLTYSVAKLYFELGDYAQSVLEADKVVNNFATTRAAPDAMLLKAQALVMIEKHSEAVSAFRALIDRFPDSELQPHALFELGKLYADLGQDAQAIDVWVLALKRHPDPNLVQGAIARVRRRIQQTTPVRVGDHLTAFDRPPSRASRVSSAPRIYLEPADAAPLGTRETSD